MEKLKTIAATVIEFCSDYENAIIAAAYVGIGIVIGAWVF